MNEDRYTHFIAVGACYIDTILTVPEYPQEDAKQRASTLSKRRGGNCPNTLEVLQQLLHLGSKDPISPKNDGTEDRVIDSEVCPPQLFLLSTLPADGSIDTKFIADSFDSRTSQPPSSSSPAQTVQTINLEHAFRRPFITEAASSYIIKSLAKGTRTIVNYNALDEMTAPEFQKAIGSIFTALNPTESPQRKRKAWIHFEGRIPDVTAECILWLQTSFTSRYGIETTVSVEVEKPARQGLERLAELADVVFYSRSWAEAKGYPSAQECLSAEAKRIVAAIEDVQGLTELQKHGGDVGKSVTLCCTWGESGAGVLERTLFQTPTDNDEDNNITSRSAYRPSEGRSLEVVDTVGAGDTWIAGMLFSLMMTPTPTPESHEPNVRGKVQREWDTGRKVEFANELAGRKVQREGFTGLGRDMSHAGWFQFD